MQTLRELKAEVDEKLHAAMDEWFDVFQRETGKSTIPFFLAYIKRRRLLPADTLEKLNALQPVDISDMEAMIADFVEAASQLDIPENGEGRKSTPIEYASTVELSSHEEKQWGIETPVERSSLPSLFGLVPQAGHRPQPKRTIEISEVDYAEDDDDDTVAFESTIALEETATDDGEETQFDTGAPKEPAKYINIVDDNHQIEGELGRGAMGVVFLAKEINLNRNVAFKQIRPEAATEHELMMRFLREAQITAQLDHPSIIPVYSLIKGFRGLPAYTMKVVEGKTLDRIIRDAQKSVEYGPLPRRLRLADRLDIFLSVCRAMAYAHSKGVLHRDLKPGNILVGQYGQVYVVDWGLARLFFSNQSPNETDIQVQASGEYEHVQTKVGQLMGTPQYMSPEQAQGLIHEMDGRSDLFSLGLILYELVYLKRAIDGDNLIQIVNKLVQGEVDDIPAQSPYERIPSHLPEIIRKATAKEKEERYASVQELADELHNCLTADKVVMSPPSKIAPSANKREPSGPTTQTGSRWPLFAGMFVLVLAIIGQYAWTQYAQTKRQTERRTRATLIQTRLQGTRDLANQADRLFAQVEASLLQLIHQSQDKLTQQAPSSPPTLQYKMYEPDDLQTSLFYKDKVSLQWPVIRLPQGTDQRTESTRRNSLAQLRTIQRATVLQSPRYLGQTGSPMTTQQLLEQGLPVLSSVLAFSDGAFVEYPGRNGFPAHYVPTKTSWYKAAIASKRIIWSRPFVSAQRIRSVQIGCFQSFRPSKEEKRGVAGLILQLNYLASHFQKVAKRYPWLKEMYIFDQSGRTLLNSNHRLRAFSGSKLLLSPVDMPLFSKSSVRKAAKTNEPGHVWEPGGANGYELYAFSRINTTGWTLVTVSEWPKMVDIGNP
jgi:serine/threonine-protein kinase